MKTGFLKKVLRSTWLQRTIFTIMILALVAASIYQIYNLWAQLGETGVSKKIPGSADPKEEASLLEPFAMYLTMDGEQYAQLTQLSGHYASFWNTTRRLMARFSTSDHDLTEIEEAALPRAAGLTLLYESPLEPQALREILDISVEDCRIGEIFVIPATSRQDHMTVYCMDWEQGRIFRSESTMNSTAVQAQRFNDTFWDLGEILEMNYINAHDQFPVKFRGGTYLCKQQKDPMFYIPEIRVSFLDAEGQLDREQAAAYAMHFFSYPDVAKPVEEAETFIWYADEKRTVRYDATGLLQYVATQEVAEKKPVSLSQAFRLAVGFMETDFEYDDTLLQEVYLCEYTVEDGRYTFCWNYAYDHIPFAMSEENRLISGLDAPIRIVVEGSQVRYYHRYMLEKSMAADAVFTVDGSYMDALDRMLGEETLEQPIEKLMLEYREEAGAPVLCWHLAMAAGEQYLRVREVRV